MKQSGFFLLALVLCVTTPALAQSARDLEADRLADKLWRIHCFRRMLPWKPRMANASP